MNRQAKIALYSLAIISVFIVVTFFYFAQATHYTLIPTLGNVTTANQSQTIRINISINVTNAGMGGNISEVNITLPAGFIYINNTNSTERVTFAPGNFTNTSTLLSWANYSDYLINGSGTQGNFLFNVTTNSSGGLYNITVMTRNITSIYATNVSVLVVSPVISLLLPINNTNLTVSTFMFNATFSNNISINSSTIFVYNASGLVFSNATGLNASNITGTSNSTNLTVVFPRDGVYIWRYEIRDVANNVNNIVGDSNNSNFTITVDVNGPNVTLLSPANATSSTIGAYNFTYNVTGPVAVSNCSLSMNGPYINYNSVISRGVTNGMYNDSFTVGGYTWYINCTDILGRTNTSYSWAFTVTASGGSNDSSSGSGSGGGDTTAPSFWTSTFGYDSKDMSSQEPVTQNLGMGNRIQIKLDNEIHHVGVVAISTTAATINISSTPQQATFTVGESKKFEINGDTFYDLLVTLNGISNSKANVTIAYIHEAVPSTPAQQTGSGTNNANATTTPSTPQKTTPATTQKNIWTNMWLWIVIVIVVIFVIFWIVYSQKGKKIKGTDGMRRSR